MEMATISAIGGVLVQFIGGAYLHIYNKSLSQLNYFYDKLVTMQDTMLAIRLVDQIRDKERQLAIREKLIYELISRGTTTANIAKMAD